MVQVRLTQNVENSGEEEDKKHRIDQRFTFIISAESYLPSAEFEGGSGKATQGSHSKTFWLYFIFRSDWHF